MNRAYNHSRWAPEEDALLRQLVADNRYKAEVTRSIPGRSTQGVRDRLTVLGLTPRAMTSEERREAARASSQNRLDDALVARVRQLAQDERQLTAEAIGAIIGKSKGAIVGMCRRAGIKLPNAQGWSRAAREASIAKRRAEAARKPKNNNPCGWGAMNRAEKSKAKFIKDGNTRVPGLPRMPPGEARVSIAKATRHQCRYICQQPEVITADTPIFCGEQRWGETSYCLEHASVLLRPVSRAA